MNPSMPQIPSTLDGRLFAFLGGDAGPWKVTAMTALAGAPLPPAERVDVVGASAASGPSGGPGTAWSLKGIISNERYVNRDEKTDLVARQEGLGRPASTCASLIPIRKTAAWWALTQDERRDVLESRSAHIRTGMKYLPAIARRLHHCRDLGEPQPFDFITWFEFTPADIPAFDGLLAALRATPEWTYVDREVDIRLRRE
jgi:hypothetical protein